MSEPLFDLVVIGAGPGGYVAAIRAAQLGLKVACIEKEKALGGTCLRIGCIPSKALLESSELYHEARTSLKDHGIKLGEVALDLKSMMSRKDRVVKALTTGVASLLKKNQVTHFEGHGRLLDGVRVEVKSNASTTILAARNILLATGSKVAPLKGVEVDGTRVTTSTEALCFETVPAHLVVIGAGAIGLEMGSVWRRLGSQVTVLEYLDRILPGFDGEIAAEAQKVFAKQGLQFRLQCKVNAARPKGDGAVVEAEGLEPIECDRVLLAVGRVPCTDELGLDHAGIELDARGRIPVDDHFATKAKGVFAIGDVIEGPMLAHKAEEEAIACVERIATGYGHVHYDAIPSIVYTAPEVAGVGKTEEVLVKAGVEIRKGTFPFIANGRARALGHTEGKVKVLADARTDRLLGVHIVGPRAGDLIAEAAVAIEFGASAEDLARACHAHPTLAETVKEAALGALGRSIHY